MRSNKPQKSRISQLKIVGKEKKREEKKRKGKKRKEKENVV
jgi:hypothetical protein